MPAQNAVRRRASEKHRLARQKAKARKRGIDTASPFWRLLLSKANAEAAQNATRPGRLR